MVAFQDDDTTGNSFAVFDLNSILHEDDELFAGIEVSVMLEQENVNALSR